MQIGTKVKIQQHILALQLTFIQLNSFLLISINIVIISITIQISL
jgi:hypothetical protein